MPDAKGMDGHCERLRVHAFRLAPVLRTVTGWERRTVNRRRRRGAGGSRFVVARRLNRLWIGARWAAPALRSIRRLGWLFTGYFSARHRHHSAQTRWRNEIRRPKISGEVRCGEMR